MGIAERFRAQLETKNIFEKDIIEQKLEEKEIKFISKPVESDVSENEDMQDENSEISGAMENNMQIRPECEPTEPVCGNSATPDNRGENKFEDMETELMSKIRKTPYWDEFSEERRTRMIENWFNVKIKMSKYSSIDYTAGDKDNFVQTVLVFANNR